MVILRHPVYDAVRNVFRIICLMYLNF